MQGGFVNGKAVRPGDIGLELHLQSRSDSRSTPYDRWRAMQLAPTRGDAWRGGSEPSFVSQANQRVGPGWFNDAPRFDSGEIEVVIDGRRCVEVDGAWRDAATGEPCPLPEES